MERDMSIPTIDTLSFNYIGQAYGYEFVKEDSSIYNDYIDPDNFSPRRQWAKEKLHRRDFTTQIGGGRGFYRKYSKSCYEIGT